MQFWVFSKIGFHLTKHCVPLYAPVHGCILWARDSALVQQRELTLASDTPQCKEKPSINYFLQFLDPLFQCFSTRTNIWSETHLPARLSVYMSLHHKIIVVFHTDNLPSLRSLMAFTYQSSTYISPLPSHKLWSSPSKNSSIRVIS